METVVMAKKGRKACQDQIFRIVAARKKIEASGLKADWSTCNGNVFCFLLVATVHGVSTSLRFESRLLNMHWKCQPESDKPVCNI